MSTCRDGSDATTTNTRARRHRPATRCRLARSCTGRDAVRHCRRRTHRRPRCDDVRVSAGHAAAGVDRHRTLRPLPDPSRPQRSTEPVPPTQTTLAARTDPVPDIDLLRAIAALSVQQRSVVFLAYWHDMTEAQIAETLDVARSSVHRTLARARIALRKALT